MTQPQADQVGTRLLTAFGESPDQMRAEMDKSFRRFQETAAAQQDHWLAVPAEGRWSPAQVTEHVLIVNENVGRLVALLLSDKPLRPAPPTPGETVDGKRVAPPNLRPGDGQPWSELEARWVAARTLLEGVGAKLEGADLARRYAHPFMGDLDAHDWFRMAAYHVRHHRRQLEE